MKNWVLMYRSYGYDKPSPWQISEGVVGVRFPHLPKDDTHSPFIEYAWFVRMA